MGYGEERLEISNNSKQNSSSSHFQYNESENSVIGTWLHFVSQNEEQQMLDYKNRTQRVGVTERASNISGEHGEESECLRPSV